MENRTLGFRELLSLSVGQVIGAGVVTLVGQAIGLTGRSAALSFAFAVLLGVSIILPYILLCTMIRVKGGNYSFVATILGEKWGGMYGMAFTLNCFTLGMFGLGLGSYIKALCPGTNEQMIAVAGITIFWLANIVGVSFIAKIQNVMSACLIIGLAIFIVVGLFNLRPGVMDVTSPEFFTNGIDGFFNATLILVFSCTGQSFVVAFSKEAKNPRRDVPYAILAASGVIFVVYALIAIVAAGVLPVDQVAGKPLTEVAQHLLSRPLYYAFIIGGPIMALATTMNSSYTVFSRPFHQMTRDGWFPGVFAKTNKNDVPYVLLTVIYIIAIVPVLAGYDIKTITSNSVLLSRISDIVAIIAVIRLPKVLPEAWDNRYFKISKTVYYALMTFSLCVTLFIIVLSLRTLTLPLIIFTVSAIVVFFIYATLRQKSGKVKMEKSYELQ